MRYDARQDVNAVYELIATLFEFEDAPERAMAIAGALIELGEDRSWASVWWAYGAVHHDLSDEAYARALELLARVDRSENARAAALMFIAEIESTQAIDAGSSPDPRRQATLLSEAVALAPLWPSLRLRVAYPLRELGQSDASCREAQAALDLLDRAENTGDPFESAISGASLDREYVVGEAKAFGVEA